LREISVQGVVYWMAQSVVCNCARILDKAVENSIRRRCGTIRWVWEPEECNAAAVRLWKYRKDCFFF